MAAPLRDVRLPLLGLAFFLSGAAALAYQVAWQRILALDTGVGLHSIAVIVAAFMLGLGLGSQLGAVASTRVTPSRALALFAACELGIAAYGALSCRLLYDWLHVRHPGLYTHPLRGALVHFAALAIPTILMGMSLPFLTRSMVRTTRTAGGTIAFLYGINVLGAAAGAVVTPWVFFRHYGVCAAVRAAVAANLSAGSIALGLAAWRMDGEGTETTKTAAADSAGEDDGRRFGSWIALYALSGFCALALEMLWFRVMTVSFKSTAFTFGTLLALYLLGSGIGAIAGIAFAPRVKSPRRAFLVCQCLLLAYAGAAIALLCRVPPTLPGYAWLYDLWGERVSYDLGPAIDPGSLLRLYVLLPLAIFGIPTVLMGLSYPILQRAVQDDPGTSGWKVGVLQAANIAGCVTGSLLVGMGTIAWLGTAGTFRLLTVLGLVFAALGLREPGGRRLFVVLGAALAVVAALMPSQRGLWLRLHGTADQASLVDEDPTGVVALIPEKSRWRVWAGGRWHSELPFGDIHTLLGAVPAVIHPAPREVAIVGLGSGDTAASAGCRMDVDQHVTVFELYAPERRLLSLLSRRPDAPADLVRLLQDPRFTYVVADGRNAIDRGGRLYDVIEADALWPTSPYAGNLYSLEFFEMCARHLRPGGLVTVWAPTPCARATFLAALPHVVDMAEGVVLIGSNSPIRIDLPAWHDRLFVPANSAYLGEPRVSHVWEGLQAVRAVAGQPAAGPLNRDLFPRDEFATPDQWSSQRTATAALASGRGLRR